MANLTALLFLGLACISAVSSMKFKVSDCANDKDHELLTIVNPHVSPYPIPIPGNVTVTGSLMLKRNFSSGMSIQLSMKRKIEFLWIPVPCIDNVGSCTYNSVCHMLQILRGHCPQEVTNLGLKCGCPIPKGTYSLNNLNVSIPRLPGALASFANGDYSVYVYVKDGGRKVACQHVEASLST